MLGHVNTLLTSMPSFTPFLATLRRFYYPTHSILRTNIILFHSQSRSYTKFNKFTLSNSPGPVPTTSKSINKKWDKLLAYRCRRLFSNNYQKNIIGTKSSRNGATNKSAVKIETTNTNGNETGFKTMKTKFIATNKGPIKWWTLFLSLTAFGGIVWIYSYQKQSRIQEAVKKNSRVMGKPLLGGPWSLVDHTGRPVTDATLTEGGHTHALLYFGFTFCPDICPAELIKMKKVIERLDEMPDIGAKVLPVFITVDPKRDGVAQVAHYIKDFHPRMLGLTGTPGQIRDACLAYRVYHNVADLNAKDEDDYLVDHSIVMYLIGPDGLFLDFYTQLAEVDECVQRIQDMILNPPQYIEDELGDEEEKEEKEN